MRPSHTTFKRTVTAFASVVMFSLPLSAHAESDGTSALDRLRQAPTPEAAARVVREIQLEWSRSGSASMDLLLTRGRDALERGDLTEAVEHLTALTDHAPDFAEGWHTRAMVFFQQKRFGLAAADLERTLALNPDHFGAIRGIGAIYETLGDGAMAYAAYKLAETYNPLDKEIVEGLKRTAASAVGVDL